MNPDEPSVEKKYDDGPGPFREFTGDEKSDRFSVGSLILGFYVGLAVGIGCLVLDFILGLMFSSVGPHSIILNTLLTAALLIGIGVMTAQTSKDKGFIRGMLIALSLAFIVCTACGISFLPR